MRPQGSTDTPTPAYSGSAKTVIPEMRPSRLRVSTVKPTAAYRPEDYERVIAAIKEKFATWCH